MLYRAEGIVIRSMDYGEGNKILTIYTKEWGKMSVMARGARKLKSRHSAAAQLFSLADYGFYKNGDMGTVNHSELIHSYHKIREDLFMAAYAAYIAELYLRLVDPDSPHRLLFEQLQAAFDSIEEGKDAQIVTHILEMKVLGTAGYSPVLERCAACGSTERLTAFHPMAGGIVCSKCAKSGDSERWIALPEKAQKLLRLLQYADLNRIGSVSVQEQSKKLIKTCLHAFMDAHIDIHWKSRNFIDQMDKYGL